LQSYAESLYPRYANRKGITAYMVMQATMWTRLAAHQREQAVEPFLRCYAYLKQNGQTGQSVKLPGRRRLIVDMKTAVSAVSVATVLSTKALIALIVMTATTAITLTSNPRTF
jgi:hypothetical protein